MTLSIINSNCGFVRVRRALVEGGAWKRLWDADHGISAGTLVVLMLRANEPNASGYSSCPLRWLGAMAGLPQYALGKAQVNLAGLGLVKFAPHADLGTWSFRLHEDVGSAGDRDPAFYLPAWLVTHGVWAGFPPATKCLLIALLSVAKVRMWYGEEEEVAATDSELFAWLAARKAIMEREDHMLAARRVVQTTLRELSCLSGLSPRSVSRALATLNQTSIVNIRKHQREVSVHFPDYPWHPSGVVADEELEYEPLDGR